MNLIPTFIQTRLAHRPNLLKILENIGWLFFDKILRLGIGLGISIWLARYLGPERFGLLNFALAMATFFSALAVMGLRNIVVRDIVRHPDDAGTILGSAILLQTIGGITAYGLLIGTIYLLRPDAIHAQLVVAIVGLMLIFKVGEVPKYWFEAQVQSKYAVFAENSMYLLSAGVKVTLILYEAPLIAIACAFTLDFMMIAIGLFVMLAWKGIKIGNVGIHYQTTFDLLKNSWPLIFSSLAIMIYMKLDQLMLGQMVGDRAVGIYSAAVKVSEAWYFIAIAVCASVFPAILKARSINESLYYSRLQHLYDGMVALALLVAIPMTFLSSWLTYHLYGDQFISSGPVLAIHIWASIFVFLGVASGKWFIAENKQILTFYKTAAGAVSNILLNYFLIPILGGIGAALATILSYAISALLCEVFWKETRVIFYMKLKSIFLINLISNLKSLKYESS